MPEKFPIIEQSKDGEILPEDFFGILKTRDEEKIKSLRKRMIAEKPENIEMIEATFWLFNLLVKRERVAQRRDEYSPEQLEEIKKEIFSSTEKQFLLTQFIYSNSENRELLVKFWDIGEELAREFDREKALGEWRNGLLSQVSAWHLLKKMGKKPQLSHPDEDARYSIDLWGDKKMAVQVKTDIVTRLKKVGTIALPAVSYRHDKAERLVSTRGYSGKLRTFMVNLEKYGKLKGRKIEGYWLKMGKSERDDITGMPTEEVVERIKKEFEKIEKK
jgi:hypothetical protein